MTARFTVMARVLKASSICAVYSVLLNGCASELTVATVERLDEQTALTIAVLQTPIGFTCASEVFAKEVSHVYVGPVEWNRMGSISYSLWFELAPTNEQHFKDVTDAKSVTFLLDEGSLTLPIGKAPTIGRDPYHAVASWGQIVYFDLTLDDLKRLAATRELRIQLKRIGGTDDVFEPAGITHPVLTRYLNGRMPTGEEPAFRSSDMQQSRAINGNLSKWISNSSHDDVSGKDPQSREIRPVL